MLLRILLPSLWRRRSFDRFAAGLRAADYDLDLALRDRLPKAAALTAVSAEAAADADAELRRVKDGSLGLEWAVLRQMLERDPARRIRADVALARL